MAAAAPPSPSHPSHQESFKENDYVKLISKKLRALNKKLNISIVNIEKKIAAGSSINDDERKLFSSKEALLKEAKNLEKLRMECLEIQKQEEKIPNSPKSQPFKIEPQEASVSALIAVLQATLQLKEANISATAFSQQDSQAIKAFGQIIMDYTPSNSVAVSTEHAKKFLSQSEEHAVLGKTYKEIYQLATLVITSPLVTLTQNNEYSVHETISQSVEKAPNDQNIHEAVTSIDAINNGKEEQIPSVQQEEVYLESQSQEPISDSQEEKEGEINGESSNGASQEKRFFRSKQGERGRGGRGRGRYRSDRRDGNPRDHREPKEGTYKPKTRGRGMRDGYNSGASSNFTKEKLPNQNSKQSN